VRIIGLDVGAKRIGVAISDATGLLARPAGVLHVQGLGDEAIQVAVAEVTRLHAEDEGVAAVIVGLPARLDGSPNEMTPRVRAFAAELARRLPVPVELQDERLTSREAESRLAHTIKDWRTRKARLDAAAAAVILQDYLDGCARPAPAADRHDA
jgi:putative Holliday junction resolvase